MNSTITYLVETIAYFCYCVKTLNTLALANRIVFFQCNELIFYHYVLSILKQLK